jgi:hypothetical protein
MSSDQKVSVLLSSMGRDHASRGDFRRKSLNLDKPPMMGRLQTERRRSSFAAASVSTGSGIGTEKIERRGSIVHR